MYISLNVIIGGSQPTCMYQLAVSKDPQYFSLVFALVELGIRNIKNKKFVHYVYHCYHCYVVLKQLHQHLLWPLASATPKGVAARETSSLQEAEEHVEV